MCKECGCGMSGDVNVGGASESTTPLSHAHGGHGGQGHSHDEPHEHDHAAGHRHSIDVFQSLLEKNDRLAERNRGFFKAKGLLVLNMVSSPGSGKTTFIQKMAAVLGQKLRLGVIVGDLATDNDAARLRSAGVPVVQVTTGTVCHLDAEMVSRAAGQLPLDALDLLVIENVGNLVCPAAFDLGEDLRVVLLSVTEGEDKPLKYPPIFHSAQAVVVSKMDLAAACEFDRKQALANLRRISHHARIFEVLARTGQGLDDCARFLMEQHKQLRVAALPRPN